MNKMWRLVVLPAFCAFLLPGAANGQSVDVLGTRAAGMGGAFVGVADDASAVYWNPAGLASGSYVSLLLDGGVRKAVPDNRFTGHEQSSFLLAASMPALGLSYYRISHASVAPEALLQPAGSADALAIVPGETHVRVDTLVTHHTGITFVQSLFEGVAVGSTLKIVHGSVSTRLSDLVTAEEALDADTPEDGTDTRFDLDFGLMAAAGKFKAGLTVRNVREPEFSSPEGRTLKLDRQARAGVSYAVLAGLTVAGDLDLTTSRDAFGERRDAAFGLEARLATKAWLRSGVNFNTVDDAETGSRRAFTFGGTFAATASVMLDGVVISGGDHAGRGWGISARFVY